MNRPGVHVAVGGRSHERSGTRSQGPAPLVGPTASGTLTAWSPAPLGGPLAIFALSQSTSRALLVVAALFLLAQGAPAADWPHWRGPERNGLSGEDSGWKAGAWPPGKPLWGHNAGKGASSPVVVDGKVYTFGWTAGQDRLACLDAASGKELWAVSYKCPQYGRHHAGDEFAYSGSSSTPEVDTETGLLYTLATDGGLNCWDTRKKGAKVWGFNLYDRYRAGQRPKVGRRGLRDYGYTSSSLVSGNALLVEVGTREGNLMAFDKRTGRRLWASECKDPAGHTGGPALITVEGVPCVAVLTIRNLVVVRLDQGNEGKTVASYPWITDFANNIAGPSVHGNHVLITSAYNHDAICNLEITLQGARKVWEKPYPSKVCTPVVYNGHIYWAWRTLRCLDLKTGELKWEGGNFGDAGSCIVTRDGRIIVWGGKGKLVLAETADRSPKKYRELAVKDRVFSSIAWPHVVLSDGRLYCKDRDGNLRCYLVSR
jgi:outer membrane protein assembly factor BamB